MISNQTSQEASRLESNEQSGRPHEASVEYLQQLQMLEALHNDVFGTKIDHVMFETSMPKQTNKTLMDQYSVAESDEESHH